VSHTRLAGREAWLSYLATRQPWEDDVTTAQNEATFLQASAAIATCITRASGRPAPHGDRGQQQLHRLVLDWRIHSSPVLTFNYDLLVERVVEEWEPSVTGSDLYPVPLVERDAVGAAARTGYAEARQPSFELYKLHGSINWFHSPSNSTGPITVPAGRPTATTSEGQRQRYLYSDLRPLVVPPTTTKSAFYGGDAMRALWRNASEALKTTDQLVVIGYSFPPSDLQVLTMLRQALPRRARILIVTRDEDVVLRARLAFGEDRVESLVDDEAADLYVDQMCGQIIEWKYRPEVTGQDQWLKSQTASTHRFVTTGKSPIGPQQVFDELAAPWPSLVKTWRDFPSPVQGQHPIYRAYIDKPEWDACANPWTPESFPNPSLA